MSGNKARELLPSGTQMSHGNNRFLAVSAASMALGATSYVPGSNGSYIARAVSGLLGPARSDSGRLVRHLRVHRRPGRVEHAVGAVPRVHLQQLLEGLGLLVHRLPRVADLREPLGNRVDRELIRVNLVELAPGDRRGNLSARPRPHRPGSEYRLVRRVLVVIDEHA